MSGYLLPFEIVSVHLVVVLIGAAYLASPTPSSRSGGRLTAERMWTGGANVGITIGRAAKPEGYAVNG